MSPAGVRAQQGGHQGRAQQGWTSQAAPAFPAAPRAVRGLPGRGPGYFKCLKIIPWAPSWLFIGAYSQKSPWGLEPCYAKSSPNTY